MLWEVEIRPINGEKDYEGLKVLSNAASQGIDGLKSVSAARTFLIQGDLTRDDAQRAASELLVDPVTEQFLVRQLPSQDSQSPDRKSAALLNVLFHPGVTDCIADNAAQALARMNLSVTNVATCRRYWVTGDLDDTARSS